MEITASNQGQTVKGVNSSKQLISPQNLNKLIEKNTKNYSNKDSLELNYSNKKNSHPIRLVSPLDLFNTSPTVTQNTNNTEIYVKEWQKVANNIIHSGQHGIENYTQLEFQPNLTSVVSSQTTPIEQSQDKLKIRNYSMRPRIGNSYKISGEQILDKTTNMPAVPAAVIFDRSNNLIVAYDKSGKPIIAFEARNNTVKHFEDKSEEWLMQNSMKVGTNAPAPNGIYAIAAEYKDDPNSGKTFGSYKIAFAGGKIADRAILIHSRDYSQNKEIAWTKDATGLQNKTHGCFLMQDPDLVALANLLKEKTEPVAFVVQGSYKINYQSPLL